MQNKESKDEILYKNKKNFLDQLSQMTPLEINKFINSYGKKPKTMNLLIIYNK